MEVQKADDYRAVPEALFRRCGYSAAYQGDDGGEDETSSTEFAVQDGAGIVELSSLLQKCSGGEVRVR
eukprot:IDg827t1